MNGALLVDRTGGDAVKPAGAARRRAKRLVEHRPCLRLTTQGEAP